VLQNMTNEPARHTEVLPEGESDDIVWGMTAIGRVIGRSPKEVGYLLNNTTLLNGVVKRISHKVTIASRRDLRNLAVTARARD
jgi:hypothetical protein